MIKSTKEFIQKKNTVIELIYQHGSEFREHVTIDDIELHDVLFEIINENLVHGIKKMTLVNESLDFTCEFPRLTHEGLEYYESMGIDSSWGL